MSCFSLGYQGSADRPQLILSALRQTQLYLGLVIYCMCEKAGEDEELSQPHQEQQMQRLFKKKNKLESLRESPFRGVCKALQWQHNGTRCIGFLIPVPLQLEKPVALALDCCLRGGKQSSFLGYQDNDSRSLEFRHFRERSLVALHR